MPSTNNSGIKLQNSLDLKKKLSNTVIPLTHQLVSFDVKALFTSIPQDFAIECISNFLQNNQDIF